MRFLLDENFPCSIATVLRDCGHEAVLFDAACECGASDEVVFAAAQSQGAVLLTSDREAPGTDTWNKPCQKQAEIFKVAPQAFASLNRVGRVMASPALSWEMKG